MKIFNYNVEILGDDEGFIIFKCPYCESEFKLSAGDLQDFGDIYNELFCPYCGLSKETKAFYTKEIKAKATRVKVDNLEIEGKKDVKNNDVKLYSNKALDLSFSNMISELDKNEDFYRIKLDNKPLEVVNVDRLKDKATSEVLYECSICGSKEKVLSDNNTIFFCSYCGVNL